MSKSTPELPLDTGIVAAPPAPTQAPMWATPQPTHDPAIVYGQLGGVPAMPPLMVPGWIGNPKDLKPAPQV